MTNIPSNPPVNFIDNPHAPEVYADWVTGLGLFNGNIRITLESYRIDHSKNPGPVNRVVIGRLVMPLNAAENLRDFLTDYIKRAKASTELPSGPVTIQ